MARKLFYRSARYLDWLVGLVLFLLTFLIYLRTLAPSVAEMFDDSLEFQLAAPRMAILHPTGYPLFSILIKLATFLPVGDVAYRVNLVTALFGALSIAILYAVTRLMISSRAAGFVAALVFAFGETFWSQSNLAEVYTLQAFLTAALLWLALKWGAGMREKMNATGAVTGKPSTALPPEMKDRTNPSLGGRPRSRLNPRISLTVLAFFFGLLLTHHRMSILLLPALAVYILSYDRSFLRQPRTLAGMALAFALPLLVYLYVPIRGLSTSSLDGAYQNTPSGFISWVLASAYGAFITQNPLNQQREATYYFDLFARQFTLVGLGIAGIGFVALGRNKLREWLLLALALAANLAFALTYRVADIDVFFIPSFLLIALFLAVGIDWVAQIPANTLTNERLYAPLSAIIIILTMVIPYSLIQGNFRKLDLSEKWDVHDYGLDVLSQPLPPNSTVVGILGEVSLLRYFQDIALLRRDVQTVAADAEPDRMAEIAKNLENGRNVFLTRQLAGAEKKYSLVSFGPLVLVQAKPNKTAPPSPSHPLSQKMGGVTLLGFDLDLSRLGDTPDWHLTTGRLVRVTLYWRVDAKITNDRFVSLKLLNASGLRAGQLDRRPVLDAYPTKAWRVGEFISDTYELPVFAGAAPGDYNLQATLYDSHTGQVNGQTDLAAVALAPDMNDHPAQALDVEHERLRDFGGVMLVGYSVDASEPYSAGASIPVTLLWRASRLVGQRKLELRLVDSDANTTTSYAFGVDGDELRAGEYLRQDLNLELSKDQPAGSFAVQLDNAGPEYLTCELPLFTFCTKLGNVRVK